MFEYFREIENKEYVFTSQGYSQDDQRQDIGDSYSSSRAIPALVPSFAPKFRKTSKASLAQSTVNNYRLIGNKFDQYLAKKKLRNEVTTQTVVDFLRTYLTLPNKYCLSYVLSIKMKVLWWVSVHCPALQLDNALLDQYTVEARELCRPTEKANIWNPWISKQIVNHLVEKSFPSNIEELARRTATILAVVLKRRAHDLRKLSVHVERQGTDTIFSFLQHSYNPVYGVIQQSEQWAISSHPNPEVCPVYLTREYIRRTTGFPNRSKYLFLQPDTGARVGVEKLRGWLVDVLLKAGISTSMLGQL